MKDPTDPVGKYIRKTGEDTRRYVQNLLQENERLRLRLADHETRLGRIVREASQVSQMLTENRNLQAMVGLMEEQLASQKKLTLSALAEAERTKEELRELEGRLHDVESENHRFLEQYQFIESHNNNLVNLYVTSYRLHATLNRDEVLAAINETVINLIGSEDFAVYELDRPSRTLRLVNSFGIERSAFETVALGEGPIGEAAEQNELRIYENGDGGELPCERRLSVLVPLQLDGELYGAIAIFSLLPQKDGVEDLDRELFDLLGTHAATALYCTNLHAGVGPLNASPGARAVSGN